MRPPGKTVPEPAALAAGTGHWGVGSAMMPILMAVPATYALFGAALALILLLVFQLRLARRHQEL